MTALARRAPGRERWFASALALGAAAALVAALPAGEPAPASPFGHGYAHGHAMSAPGTGAAARPASESRVVACSPLPNVPGKSITTVMVTYPPNGKTPPHRHPGSVTAVVLKGAVLSGLNGQAPRIYRPGEAWFEPPGTLHSISENASAAEPAEFLAIFVADSDCGPLVIFEK
jgi:quercetin dioxygenase-like cupin family protein